MHRAAFAATLALAVAAGLHADSAQDVHELFERAAGALSDGKPADFLAAFDASMPGLAKLRGDVTALLRTSSTQSRIEWEKNEGDTQTHSVRLNWLLEITEKGGTGATTLRQSAVSCQLKMTPSGWRVTTFAPADFFAPPQVEDAWNVVVTAALGLSEAAAPGVLDRDAAIPAENTGKFMDAFDRSMPSYVQLKSSVLALEQGSDVESTVDLIRNEGDDRTRTIEVEWSLNLIYRETNVTAVQRSQRVTCKLEKQGKRWRITSIDPLSFFAPPVRPSGH